jgi:hypothetical protein
VSFVVIPKSFEGQARGLNPKCVDGMVLVLDGLLTTAELMFSSA